MRKIRTKTQGRIFSSIDQILWCYSFFVEKLQKIYMSNLQIVINISTSLHVIYITAKMEFDTAKLFALIESVQILILLIEDYDLENWLTEKGYSEQEVLKLIL